MRANLVVLVCLLLFTVSFCNGDKPFFKTKKHDKLSIKFYEQSCPDVETIVRKITWAKVTAKPKLAAKLLRLHFHDCFVRGCDASILLDSVDGKIAEKDAIPNGSVSGYEVIDEIKTELEKDCPGTVSCADVLALAARDAVSYQYRESLWPVFTGRTDGTVSIASEAASNLPAPTSNFTTLQRRFGDNGLNVIDLVALSGAHTIGVTHCSSIARRLYNFTGNGDTDPTIDPESVKTLKQICQLPINVKTTVEMDFNSSLSFDSHYFKALNENKGLFQSDGALLNNPASKRIAEMFENQTFFFRHFAESMVKMGSIGVLTGDEGEIRGNCRAINK